jgi:membrane protease YdiL (CAAX protease family)
MTLRRALAGHPVGAFLVIGYAVYLAAALIPPLAETEITPLKLPLWASVGTIFGVGLAAFLVTAASDGRAGVDDLVRRCLRWRVSVRWYVLAILGVPVAVTLIAIAVYGGDVSPADGWLHVLGTVLALFVLQVILFNFAEEIGFTGFLQDRWQDRYGPLRLSATVALLWAVWHLPDFFVDEGWTLAQLAVAPLFVAFEFVVLFFARVVIVWLYTSTGRSVLLVGLFHASFDATISKLSKEIIPGSNGARYVIVTGVVVIGAFAVIAVTRGRLGPSARGTRTA